MQRIDLTVMVVLVVEFSKEGYSHVPIKRVGPNKRVGWIFYILNK